MKTIKFNQNGTGRYDDVSPFIITDKSLKLKIALPEQSGEYYLVTENNGNKEQRLLGGDVTVIDNLTAGEFNAAVEHYFKGELIKTYRIEPLILKEVNGEISAEPEIIALKSEIAEMKTALSELGADIKDKAQELEQWKLKAIRNISALIRFAYTDNSVNVYLEGGTAREFTERFGFDLNEQEIKEIFGGEENE